MNVKPSTWRFNHLLINDINASQNPNIIKALEELNAFLINERINISTIIEIGTLNGGFTSILAESDLSKGTKIHTFDIRDKQLGCVDKYNNVFFHKEDVFSTNTIVDLLKSDGNCLLFCDGGNKINEFNLYSNNLKKNDFIFCHDYVTNKELFEEQYRNKIWNWHESNYEAIEAAILKNNLENILPEFFEPAVWASYRKK